MIRISSVTEFGDYNKGTRDGGGVLSLTTHHCSLQDSSIEPFAMSIHLGNHACAEAKSQVKENGTMSAIFSDLK